MPFQSPTCGLKHRTTLQVLVGVQKLGCSLRSLVWMVSLALSTGCSRGDGTQVPASTAAHAATDFYTVAVGGKAVRMQLAVKRAEMEHGLMGRTDLKSDEGMLFVYADPQRMSFWMRNTPTPLDIGFFTADGVLREIYPMYPFDETPVASRCETLVYALEMKQGWFEFNAVKPGAQLDLKALAAALQARDFSPAAYGLK